MYYYFPALREKVENELKRLVKEWTLKKKMKRSDWATPVVPVLKPDGTVRICGDFKLAINPYLDVPEYPIMPTPVELFTKLNGGELFTKLDLSLPTSTCSWMRSPSAMLPSLPT